MPRRIKGRITHIEPLLLTVEEAALALGVSMDAFYRLREHPLYKHDSDAPTRSEKKEGQPRWRQDKIKFIVFARSLTPQGDRQYDDDFAFQLWNKIQEQQDREYKKMAGCLSAS